MNHPVVVTLGFEKRCMRTEYFGKPEYRSPSPWGSLAFNLPYVLISPLLIRKRKVEPFGRKY